MADKIDALTAEVQLKSEADVVIFMDTMKGNIINWYRAGGPPLRLAVEFDLIKSQICTLDLLPSSIRAASASAGILTKFLDGTFRCL